MLVGHSLRQRAGGFAQHGHRVGPHYLRFLVRAGTDGVTPPHAVRAPTPPRAAAGILVRATSIGGTAVRRDGLRTGGAITLLVRGCGHGPSTAMVPAVNEQSNGARRNGAKLETTDDLEPCWIALPESSRVRSLGSRADLLGLLDRGRPPEPASRMVGLLLSESHRPISLGVDRIGAFGYDTVQARAHPASDQAIRIGRASWWPYLQHRAGSVRTIAIIRTS